MLSITSDVQSQQIVKLKHYFDTNRRVRETKTSRMLQTESTTVSESDRSDAYKKIRNLKHQEQQLNKKRHNWRSLSATTI